MALSALAALAALLVIEASVQGCLLSRTNNTAAHHRRTRRPPRRPAMMHMVSVQRVVFPYKGFVIPDNTFLQ